jgi:phytoene dehydrogenase-like protein
VNPIVVIGAGLAGLSAACYLAGRVYDVTVLERKHPPGGRAGVLQLDGFTFETGPTVPTMPDLIADAVRVASRDPSAKLHELMPMRRLDPACRAFFADGSTINVRSGREAMRDEIAQTCGSLDAAAFDSFVDWLRNLYKVEMPNFIDRNYDSPLGLLSSPRALAQMMRARRLRQARRGGAETIRRSATPSTTQLSGHVRRAVARLGPCTLRSDHLYGHDRGRLVSRGRHARGPYGDLRRPRAARRGKYSPSAAVWHVGVRGVPNSPISHHNIHFGEEWSTSFNALSQGGLMPEPSRLVTIPSLDDSTMAPPGCSTLYVLEPVPNVDSKINWSTEAKLLRDRLHAFLDAHGYPSEAITEHLVTPKDWQAQGMAAGTPFALVHTFGQTGPSSPSNVERQLPGMFFAGSGTVPGVGVPMVLISGKLAASRVATYLREQGQ